MTDAKVWVLVSLRVPVAVRDWTPPTGMDRFAGLTEIEANPVGASEAG
jgi:hypothetical protein